MYLDHVTLKSEDQVSSPAWAPPLLFRRGNSPYGASTSGRQTGSSSESKCKSCWAFGRSNRKSRSSGESADCNAFPFWKVRISRKMGPKLLVYDRYELPWLEYLLYLDPFNSNWIRQISSSGPIILGSPTRHISRAKDHTKIALGGKQTAIHAGWHGHEYYQSASGGKESDSILGSEGPHWFWYFWREPRPTNKVEWGMDSQSTQQAHGSFCA